MIRKIFSLILFCQIVSGCTENRASFYIQDMKVPTEECVIPADKSATYYSWGIWDIGLLGAYHVHPLTINDMTSSKKLNPLAAESNLIQVDGAWVTVMDLNDNELSGESFVPSPCTVEPEGGATSMDFETITKDMYSRISDLSPGVLYRVNDLCTSPVKSTIILRIKVTGVTAGGQNVETPYFYFPVTVCCGCLVYFPSDTWDESIGSYNCHSSESTTTEKICFLDFQDGPVDCRLCAGYNSTLCDPATPIGTFCNPWLFCP